MAYLNKAKLDCGITFKSSKVIAENIKELKNLKGINFWCKQRN